ncbi:MAG: hypothetical protein IJM58_05085 [Muribaculaceae bacterium]|nr:hypothetical protein [Muribaculaceae bacterium]
MDYNLHLDLTNCYGIGRLEHDIKYDETKRVAIVYAPNGSMKTSLTKSIIRLLDKKIPTDEIFISRPSQCSITLGNEEISNENVYIFSNENVDGSKVISTFLVNETLKKQYDEIYQLLDGAKNTLKKKIKDIARSSDCEKEILEAFRSDLNETYFDCLIRVHTELAERCEYLENLNFRYNDLFDSAGKVKQFVIDNIKDLQQFFTKYQELLSTSVLFTSGQNSFGTTQVSSLLKSVDDNRFFGASHKFILKDTREIKSKEEMDSLIQEEYKRIFSDVKLKKLFDKIDKKLQANNELRNFKEIIQCYPEIVAELVDYEALRKKILRGYLKQCESAFNDLISLYNIHKKSIESIIKEANEQRSVWERIIDLFNGRFFVPFRIKLQNKADILLNESAPELSFLYSDDENETPIEKERKFLIDHLSRGEQKAFFILQNIFEIEARRNNGIKTLLVFDDIADSFDYKNKYAIVEYLADLSKSENFLLLVLTHNFDFYRTVVSRLKVPYCLMALRHANRVIEFKPGPFKTDILKNKLLSKLDTSLRAFIGTIPFARNIIEYTSGENEEYHKLTACLHIKMSTKELIMSDVFSIFKTTFNSLKELDISFGEQKYIDVLFSEAEVILKESDDISLVNKLTLSIAIRLKAESYIISVLSLNMADLELNNNQTGTLIQHFKDQHQMNKEYECQLLDRVLMLTSENIHINNFMFEPLIDISIQHLKQLYKDVSALK